MREPSYRQSRFEAGDDDPMGPLANLADIMLVFAVGLMVALAASKQGLKEAESGGVNVEKGQEMPEVPTGAGETGSGYEAVGRVYRDPETGEMVMIGGEE